VLITAGPTFEDVDPVRFLGNRSSGRMGFAIAAEAARRGAQVTLVAGPTSIAPPAVHDVIRVRSARDMHAAVLERAPAMDVVVMAAAVADYAPVVRSPQKIAKDSATLTLELERTPDILGDLGRARTEPGQGPLLVGFAAETEDVVARASAKLERKQVDLVVANDVSRDDIGFDVDVNEVTVVGRDGVESLPRQRKAQVAAGLVDRIEGLLRREQAARPGSWTPASSTRI
jgi:phosphopantothenoylcysteine decarboxylase/phosphopantothenate--cysteine ligase